MLVTLLFFIVGSVVGAAQLHWWNKAPTWRPISLVHELSLARALFLQLSVIALIVGITVVLEKRRYGRLETLPLSQGQGWRRVFRGPWPLFWGAVGLALLNFATLALAGRPWGVTSAFALWGSKGASAIGVNVSAWPYWATPSRAEALRASVFTDVTSVMNFGIMIGAFAAAGLAGKFVPGWSIPLKSLLAAVIGGFLLGYGARLAYGCNIGAFLGGIASSSIHGWLWFVAALAGTAVGSFLRLLFGMGRGRGLPVR